MPPHTHSLSGAPPAVTSQHWVSYFSFTKQAAPSRARSAAGARAPRRQPRPTPYLCFLAAVQIHILKADKAGTGGSSR